MTDQTKSNGKEIVIAKTFDTSRQKVWDAWTKPDQIEQWWGPRGFTTRVDEMNFEPGGKWTYVMLDEEENEYPSEGIFKEISEGKRLVTTDEFGNSDNNDNAAPEGLPTGMVTTVDFNGNGDTTSVNISIMHQSVEDREKHEEMGVVDGFNQQLDKLAEYLD
ncbi:SRPBCC domain-containing protein [Fodinibius halophilus]|uniref:Activator of Hsp90 ATPase homologue 1/2-like C-terminal domain-containing protein n=1 Tax=Fodinibius halophilus TaxID=1736908 RepID=A0A6M1SZP9_9BACT|nr:SRPBCC domain-containing protein [Fodinibius halophilus]NGP87109.1 hypothetical protein [Fodinibius halophilus]